jgi:integrase
MTQDLIHCLEPNRRGKGSPRRINAGKLTGQKPALKMKEVWAIRARLELRRDVRELALFNMAIDSKLRGCDLVRLRVGDVAAGGEVKNRAIIVQKKTGTPVQFEITEQTRRAVVELIRRDQVASADYLFRSRLSMSAHLSTRQYARIVQAWVRSIGLNPATYGTHSLRRTKAALIYRKTGNLRAVQLLLGHSKLESTVRYLGVEVDDALAISEGVDL